MKTENKILLAFAANLLFSIFEFFGGIITGSIAIASDAVHDMGDALGIGLSFALEKQSKKQPDKKYTYGYGRFSVLGGTVTSLILLIGSVTVIFTALKRIINPVDINYNGMLIFAIAGVAVNGLAALLTRGGDSVNQKAVNLHMFEDVLGWITVLIGSVVIRYTDLAILDPILSLCVSIFILINAVKNLKESVVLFLEKAPLKIDVDEIIKHLSEINGVLEVHHVHLWSINENTNCATVHIVTDENFSDIKSRVREELKEHGIGHITIELESEFEECPEKQCIIKPSESSIHHHHHH
ncbi:MAG: cation transporter [Ruminococcaceae bacterium]|nr:cation transporter [Oscillospiraceae bacterium]